MLLTQLIYFYGKSNMLLRTCGSCSYAVKLQLFMSYCAFLWCDFTQRKYRQVEVACNNVFRRFLGYDKYCSASSMFVENRTDGLDARIRKLVYGFRERNVWKFPYCTPPPPPLQRSWKGGILVSPCPSVRPSVCPSVDRIVSALYLQQYSSDPNLKFWQIFKICNFDFVFFWLGIQYDSMVWVIIRRRGYPQNAGVLVVLVETVIKSSAWRSSRLLDLWEKYLYFCERTNNTELGIIFLFC